MPDLQSKKQIGDTFEQLASDFLTANGLSLITKNYICKAGEIDLIMQDQDEIVFVEVRRRAQTTYGNAVESIHPHKQKKLLKSALYFLQQKNWLDKVNGRFDIIGFSNNRIEWIKDAFSYE